MQNELKEIMKDQTVENNNKMARFSLYHVLSILPNNKEDIDIRMRINSQTGNPKNIAFKIPYNKTNPNDLYKTVSIYHRIKNDKIVLLDEIEIYKRVEELHQKNPYVLKETILFNEISKNRDLPQCSQSEYDKQCHLNYDSNNGIGFYNCNVWIEYCKCINKNK
jgi:hypothetical protein